VIIVGNILFVGDTHFSNKIPISRKDDYPNTLISKLQSLGKLFEAYDVTDVIFLGDLFNTKGLDLGYFTRVLKEFLHIKALTGVRFYTVVGNHDLLYRNRELLDASPISMLRLVEAFEDVQECDIQGYTFRFCDFTTSVTDIPKATTNNEFLIGHYFFENGFNDVEHTLTVDLCKSLGYKYYVLGHDHTPYEPVFKNGFCVYRPGSFSRGTSQTAQIKRETVDVLLFDTAKCSFSLIAIPDVLSVKDAFKEQVLIDKVLDTSLKSLNVDFTEFLDNFKFDSSQSVLTTLQDMNLDDDVYQLLIKYLRLGGLIS
jgi:predicted phosphodiesterase